MGVSERLSNTLVCRRIDYCRLLQRSKWWCGVMDSQAWAGSCGPAHNYSSCYSLAAQPNPSPPLISDAYRRRQGGRPGFVVREVRSLTPHEGASPIVFSVIAHAYGRGIMSDASGLEKKIVIIEYEDI